MNRIRGTQLKLELHETVFFVGKSCTVAHPNFGSLDDFCQQYSVLRKYISFGTWPSMYSFIQKCE